MNTTAIRPVCGVVTTPEPFQWPRDRPLLTDCPKGFHFGDYVETNDRSAAGFIRGVMGQQSAAHSFYLIQTHDDGDIIPVISGALRLVFRITDPEVRAVAYAAYVKARDELR